MRNTDMKHPTRAHDPMKVFENRKIFNMLQDVFAENFGKFPILERKWNLFDVVNNIHAG